MSAPIMGYEGYNSPALSKIFCSNKGEVCKNIIFRFYLYLNIILTIIKISKYFIMNFKVYKIPYIIVIFY